MTEDIITSNQVLFLEKIDNILFSSIFLIFSFISLYIL